jgi:hypothetical protein
MIDRRLPAGNAAEKNKKSNAMKKIILFLSVMTVFIFSFTTAYSKPILIGGVKIYWAKWAVTFNDCHDGNGLCFAIIIGGIAPDNFIGYDAGTDKIILMIGKKEPEALNVVQSNLSIAEDSPIDPKIINKIQELKTDGKTVILRKGMIKANEDAKYYTFNIPYYLQ